MRNIRQKINIMLDKFCVIIIIYNLTHYIMEHRIVILLASGIGCGILVLLCRGGLASQLDVDVCAFRGGVS